MLWLTNPFYVMIMQASAMTSAGALSRLSLWPVHLLVMPRKHLPSLQEAESGDEPLLGHLFTVAAQLARERQLEARGYRAVVNNGPWAGQTVDHLHVHMLGGRVFHWPPG